MIVLHSSCVDGNCNHDDDDHHLDKDDGDHDNHGAPHGNRVH